MARRFLPGFYTTTGVAHDIAASILLDKLARVVVTKGNNRTTEVGRVNFVDGHFTLHPVGTSAVPFLFSPLRCIFQVQITELEGASGADVVGGDPPDEDDHYGFQTYTIEADGTVCSSDHTEGCLTDAHERLISVSPDDTGWRLACLVRVSPKHRGETHYKVVVYNHEMREELKHPQVWTGVNPYGKGGYDWGPSAVGMSPAADCIVVMHRTSGSCVTEIFEHVTGPRYARINAHNVCDWLRLEADDDRRTGQNVVKLRYKVGFSPCGRFAHVVDQRAYHRHYFEGHAAVVLTLSERRSSPKIPVQGLCHYERNTFDELDVIEQVGLSQDAFMPRPMRELHWGERSMWALAYRGALLFEQAPKARQLAVPN